MNRAGLTRHIPLLPRTPMPARTGPLRLHRLRRRSHRRPDGGRRGVPDNVKALVWARCEGYCERCGQRLNPLWWAPHHRLRRSQGGADCPSNVVALHPISCHTGDPDAVHNNRTAAEDRGLCVRSCQTPATCAVKLGDGRVVLLTADGRYGEVAA